VFVAANLPKLIYMKSVGKKRIVLFLLCYLTCTKSQLFYVDTEKISRYKYNTSPN